MILKLKRTPGIYLVGFMGSGKSTVGRMLAEEIGWRFADTDEDIEIQQKKTISDIFAQNGEEHFRRIEQEAIARRVRSVRTGNPLVLSIGGGAFTREENVELLTGNGVTIWLDTAFPVVKKRVSGATHRPLAKDPQRFEDLYQARREFYGKAEYRIEIREDDSRGAVQAILALGLFD